MPHLRFREINEETILHLSEVLPSKLSQIIQTSEDNFTFELIKTNFYFSGKRVNSYPFIEVLWFPRSIEIRDKTAKCITDEVHLALQTKSNDKTGKVVTNGVVIKEALVNDIVVVFTELNPSAYYENGNHYGQI